MGASGCRLEVRHCLPSTTYAWAVQHNVRCLFSFTGEKVQSAASTHGHQAVSLPRTAPSVDLMMDAQALWAQAQAHPKMDSPDIGEENPSTIQVNLGVVWGICTTAKNSGYDSKY